jgi:hypothetical protein
MLEQTIEKQTAAIEKQTTAIEAQTAAIMAVAATLSVIAKTAGTAVTVKEEPTAKKEESAAKKEVKAKAETKAAVQTEVFDDEASTTGLPKGVRDGAYYIKYLRPVLQEIVAKTGSSEKLKEVLARHGVGKADTFPPETWDALYADALAAINGTDEDLV